MFFFLIGQVSNISNHFIISEDNNLNNLNSAIRTASILFLLNVAAIFLQRL